MLTNAKTAICDFFITVRRDEFRDQIVLTGSGLPSSYHGSVSDRAITWIRNKINELYGIDPGDEHVHSAIKGLAEQNRFNPVIEQLEGLSWDGVNRLHNWLPRITGAEDTELHRFAGQRLILGMVARALHPGTKFDLCIVLEGPQGCGKSSLVSQLAGGEYFTDAPGLLAMDTKARGEVVGGRWIIELAELAGITRMDIEMVKAITSQTHDHYRGAYERTATKRPRTCIFIGTTNSSGYLMDTTGNRRFLPIRCSEKIDLRSFSRERDQILAEAFLQLTTALAARPGVVRGQPLPVSLNLGLPARLWPLASAAAEERRIVEHGEDVLIQVLSEKTGQTDCKQMPDGCFFVASVDIQDSLKFRLQHAPHNRVLAQWMEKLGWTRVRHGAPPNQVRGYSKAPRAP